MLNVPGTQIVLELIGDALNETWVERDSTYGAIEHAPLQRVSSSTLRSTLKSADTDRLTALKLSRASSDLERDLDFYQTLGCKVVERYHSADSRHEMRVITWEPPEDVEIQFWWHSDSATKGSFKVDDYEKGVQAVHKACVASYHCGFDQWMDHHYAYDGECRARSVRRPRDRRATASVTVFARQARPSSITTRSSCSITTSRSRCGNKPSPTAPSISTLYISPTRPGSRCSSTALSTTRCRSSRSGATSSAATGATAE